MKSLKQHYYINASPEEVFSAITNPFTIELWSGYPASMEAKENTEFTIFDGDIAGKNLQVIPFSKLVQEWYFGDQQDPSIVTIDLKKHQLGTKIALEHNNIPDEDFESIVEGWRDYYWEAIKEFFK